jgi:thiamine-phosphate pyrophosphorylase
MLDWMRGYYAIVDVTLEAPTPDQLDNVLARADQLLAAGPCCLQLRAKRLPAAPMCAIARRLQARCQQEGVPFCVNDRLDVAMLVRAEVVHLGQEDLPLIDAKRIAPAGMVVGYSTHDIDQARLAVSGGADYIGFGPVFQTGSKLNPDPTVGLEDLRAVCAASPVPVVAIGGIGLHHLADLAATGAAAAAVISAIAHAPDPIAAGRQIAAAFTKRS